MKLEPVTQLDKKIKQGQKNLTMTSCRKIVTSLLFFQFTTNLEQSGSRILDVQSVKLMFSLTVTIYLPKSENRNEKISNTTLVLFL